jgi:diaminohydroxyphosphoribosylaminopyrimidine deaminase/5-amino-6-(5-phosphoribosylamino)uracil reductase
MRHALALAERGRYSTHPNPRVGCVVVRDGEIVGEGWHERAGEPHAEVHALRAAGERARGADLFVTLEPCSHHGRTPPCVDAIVAAGVRRVTCAMQDPNPRVRGQGAQRLRDAGIEVETGLLAEEAARLNRGFVSRMIRNRPFVTLKLASSLDGRTAMASGESRWITGAEARADVHRLRAQAGAVLTGSETVLADDPGLSVRDFTAPALRQPDRVVLDTRGRVPATAKVWAQGARRFWFTADPGAKPANGVEAIAVESAPGGLDLAQVLAELAKREVNEVLVECGPTLGGAFLRQRLADEVITYVAPSLLGEDARPLAKLPGLQRLDQRVQLRFTAAELLGGDVKLTAVPG